MKNKFQSFKFSKQRINALTESEKKDYTVASMIMNDLYLTSENFFDISKNLPEKATTPQDHIDYSKLTSSMIILSSQLHEAYIFLKSANNRFDDINLNQFDVNSKKLPFYDIRNIVGFHYTYDKNYAVLYAEIIDFLIKNSELCKKLEFFLSVDSHANAFPATNETTLMLLYIMDSDSEWRMEYQKNKSSYIQLKTKSFLDNSDVYVNWYNSFLTKIESSIIEVRDLCSQIMTEIYYGH